MNHYVFDIETKNKISLKDVENIFSQLIKLLWLTVLKKEKHIFDNWWFTIFWLLAESHISAHYRIENNYLAMDIYSCKNLENFENEILNFVKILGNFKFTKLNRSLNIKK